MSQETTICRECRHCYIGDHYVSCWHEGWYRLTELCGVVDKVPAKKDFVTGKTVPNVPARCSEVNLRGNCLHYEPLVIGFSTPVRSRGRMWRWLHSD